MDTAHQTHPRERAVFLEAVEIEAAADRAAYLDQACGADAHLRERVEALLTADAEETLTLDGSLEERRSVVAGIEAREIFAEGASIAYFGDYELVHKIATGGMGVVWEARQTRLKRRVALKMIRDVLLASEADVQRFRAEAEAAAGLDHPNIVPIYEIGEHDGQHFYSMKLIEGGTLEECRERFAGDRRAAAALMAKVARAVDAAHRAGVLHRDLKPGNILIDAADEPHITDFGLAKQMNAALDLTLSGQVMGSPHYMAPEQAMGDSRNVSIAADIYSLGAVLYELLGRRRPFASVTLMKLLQAVAHDPPERLRTLDPTIDVDLETIVAKCLEKKPTSRYLTAGALADDLECWLHGRPIAARAIGPMERTAKWMRRKPVHAALISLATLFVLLLAIGGPLVAIRQGELKELADDRADELQRGLYVARMNLASQAKDVPSGMERVPTFLELTRPSPGQPDLRGWEWYYLQSYFKGVHFSHQENYTSRFTETGNVDAKRVMTGFNSRPARGAVAWSPDGTRLLTDVASRDIGIWDAKDGRLLKQLPGHEHQISCVAWSPDGSRFVAGDWAGAVRIWDARTDKVLRVLKGHRKQIRSVVWSPDGKTLATGASDYTIRLWNAETGETLHVMTEHKYGIYGLSWSPDGTRLASASHDNTLRLWDPRDGKLLQTIEPDQEGIASSFFGPMGRHQNGVEWSHDGTRLASVGNDSTVRIWDPETGAELKRIGPHLYSGQVVRWSHDDTRLATGGESEFIRIWDAATGKEIHRLHGHIESIHGIDWSSDDRLLASVAHGLIVQEADGQNPNQIIQIQGRVFSIAENPQGPLLAISTDQGRVELRDVITHALVKTLESGGEDASSVGWSPDGKKIATGGKGTDVCIWNSVTGEKLLGITNPGGTVSGLIWSPDGRRLAVCGESTQFPSIYDTQTGALVLKIGREAGLIISMAQSPDGRWLALGGDHSRVSIVDAATGNIEHIFPPNEGRVMGVAWHPDGDWIAAGSQGSDIPIYSWKTREQVALLKGHTRQVDAVSWSPEGTRLASSGIDKNVIVWQTGSWDEIFCFTGHIWEVRDVAWSANGHRLISGGFDGRVNVWDAEAGYEMEARHAELNE